MAFNPNVRTKKRLDPYLYFIIKESLVIIMKKVSFGQIESFMLKGLFHTKLFYTNGSFIFYLIKYNI
jgi:hypothetical protein